MSICGVRCLELDIQEASLLSIQSARDTRAGSASVLSAYPGLELDSRRVERNNGHREEESMSRLPWVSFAQARNTRAFHSTFHDLRSERDCRRQAEVLGFRLAFRVYAVGFRV